MPDGVKFSQFAQAVPDSSDKLVGLHGNTNAKFSFADIISAIRQGLASIFVPLTRTINNKGLSSNITLDASDVGAVDTADVGVADGVASLDSTGKVPSAQLPPITSTAADVTYDNTGSGLAATNVQDAIDEVYGDIPTQASDIGAQAKITASGILKGDGAGGVSAATAGTDYQAPLTAGTDYATPTQLEGKANPGQIGYPEAGTTASRNYTAGEYICWNGLTYTADTNIATGTTLSASGGNKNLTECVGGGFNNLLPVFHSVTPNSSKGVTVQDGGYWTIGKIVIVNVRLSCSQAMNQNDTLASGLPTYGGSTNWIATANNLHQDIPIGRVSGTLFLAGGVYLSAGSVVIAHSVYISN